ncbi:MAG: hypothetical protein HYS13_05845 [Planctomycetia bacterium]|nr:hypothetical protein [Planctomycetia bacterium]
MKMAALLTIEEYLRVDDSPFPTELVRGEIVVGSFHGFQHGVVCVRSALRTPRRGRWLFTS